MKKFFSIFFTIIFSISLVGCANNENLVVDYVDVNQGDSIIIKTPDNYTMLVDSGDKDYYRNVKRDLVKNHIKRINYIVASHSDSDHLGSMDEVIEKENVDALILSKDNNLKPELSEVINAAKSKHIPILRAESGDRIKLGKNVYVYFLSPKTISTTDANKNSLVMLVKYLNYNLLLTGDADKDNERQVIKDYNLPHINILKAGHHGSKTSTSEELLKVTRPDIAIISCGLNNRYNHPSSDTMNLLQKYRVKIYRTDKQGSLRFTLNKDGIFSNID